VPKKKPAPASGLGGSSPVEIDPDAFRELGYRAVDLATEYLRGQRSRPPFHLMDDRERAELLALETPEEGWEPERILTFLSERILPHTFGAHPRFYGWIVPSSAPLGALGDLLSSVANPNLGGGRESPAVYLEMAAVRTLMQVLGFPVEGSAGLLVSGGSEANLHCLAAARSWAAEQRGLDVRRDGVPPGTFVLYASDEVHNCVQRAIEILGLGSANLRRLPTTERFQIDVEALRRAIASDRKAGKVPFCVVGNLGTVGSGAIDPLGELAAVCREERLWFHVDAAYGAFALVTDRHRALRDALEQVDSMAVDPQKFLAVPLPCGVVMVRDRERLRQAFELPATYLLHDPRGMPSSPMPFYDYGLQLSRAFSALKLWCVLQQLGTRGVGQMAGRHCAVARAFARGIEASDDMELLAPVDLSIVGFRYRPPRVEGDDRLNELNHEILWRSQLEGQFVLSSTVLRGRFALRACFLNHLTTEEDVAVILDGIRRIGTSLLQT
jgi:aromatic-L-amino-acid/L-tryptophan decarboxylase